MLKTSTSRQRRVTLCQASHGPDWLWISAGDPGEEACWRGRDTEAQPHLLSGPRCNPSKKRQSTRRQGQGLPVLKSEKALHKQIHEQWKSLYQKLAFTGCSPPPTVSLLGWGPCLREGLPLEVKQMCTGQQYVVKIYYFQLCSNPTIHDTFHTYS